MAFGTRSIGTSGGTTARTPDELPGRPGSPRAELWAPVDHKHELKSPRWLRWLAVLVAALVVVVAVVVWLVWEQSNRISRLEDYVASRAQEREQERKADTRREQLIICNLLLSLPNSSPNAQSMILRLQCPPAGDPAYAAIGAPSDNG